jgi:hypothetical protein
LGKSLKEILEETPLGKNLSYDLSKMRKNAEKLLPKITETFPQYTEHNIMHSDRIIGILSDILPEELKNDMNEYELYFLIAACYFHDIGMVNFPCLSLPDDVGSDIKSIADYIRNEHHIRSEQFLCSNFKDLSIDDEHQADIIGRICLGHRKVDLDDPNLFESDRVYRNKSINMVLLAALLRLGDALDITFERAPLIIFEHSFINDPISIGEWQKHLSISGVVPQPEDKLTLKANAKCSSPKVHRLVKKLESDVDNELENLPRRLHQYSSHRTQVPRKFNIIIDAKGYKAFDFKFSLQEKEITKLLMGEKLYQRKEESLRELLKNSIDACRARKEFLRRKNQSYAPRIVVEQTADGRLIFEDNGIGMDEEIIERYFTKIGKSFYGSSDFSKSFEFTPVSELGIGFLSSFMIADRILVDTKKEKSPSLQIEIEDISDYFLVQAGKREYSGTTVTLELKKDLNFSLVNEIATYAQHIEFPIEVKMPGKTIVIEDRGFKLIADDFFKISGPERFRESFDFRSMNINLPELEGVIGLLIKKTNNNIDFDPFKRFSYETKQEFDRLPKLTISNEGVFIGNISVINYWLHSGLVFYDLNLKKKSLDLNAARNSVIKNNKFETISKIIEKCVFSLYSNLLTELRSNPDNNTSGWIENSGNFFEHYLNLYNLYNNLKDAGSPSKPFELPTEVLSIIREFSFLKCYNNGVARYYKTSYLIENADRLRGLRGLEEYSENDKKRIFDTCTTLDKELIYLVYEYGYGYYLKALLFNHVHYYDLIDLVELQRKTDLNGFIPATWTLANLKNYKTQMMIPFCHYQVTIINRDNPFIDLLIANKETFTGPKKMVVSDFFRTLKMELKRDLTHTQEKQMEILKILVESGALSADSIESYMIATNDFPVHVLKRRD